MINLRSLLMYLAAGVAVAVLSGCHCDPGCGLRSVCAPYPHRPLCPPVRFFDPCVPHYQSTIVVAPPATDPHVRRPGDAHYGPLIPVNPTE